jgi:O-acetylserine/cysteine efflux transporter
MSPRDSLLAALVAVIWGVNFVVIDWGMHGVPPLLFAAVRFTAVVLPAVFLVPRPTVGWRPVVLVGVFMSMGQFGFLYASLHAGMPPGLAALVLQAQVIFTVVIAAGALRELPTAAQVAGIVVGSAGLALVAVGRGGQTSATALLLCLAGALCWGIGNVMSRASGATGGLSLTVWSAIVVPVPLLLFSLVLDGPAEVGAALSGFSWQAAVSTAYTAGWPRWWATASSTRCSHATAPPPSCPGCWSLPRSRCSRPGCCWATGPTRRSCPVESCCSPGRWSRCARHDVTQPRVPGRRRLTQWGTRSGPCDPGHLRTNLSPTSAS